MVFVIFKRNKIENRFTVEPNRFEISPSQTTPVKIFLTAENSENLTEEFTIEACSTKFPMREVIWDSIMKASIIKPTICFSKTEMIFKCHYGEENGVKSREFFKK